MVISCPIWLWLSQIGRALTIPPTQGAEGRMNPMLLSTDNNVEQWCERDVERNVALESPGPIPEKSFYYFYLVLIVCHIVHVMSFHRQSVSEELPNQLNHNNQIDLNFGFLAHPSFFLMISNLHFTFLSIKPSESVLLQAWGFQSSPNDPDHRTLTSSSVKLPFHVPRSFP